MKRIILLYFLSFFIILNASAQESSEEILESDKKAISNEVISCYRLGIVYGLNGMYDDAIKYLEKAVRLDPLFSEAYRILGIVYSLQDNYPEAIKNLKKAIQIDPKSKDAYRILKVISGLKEARDRLKELSAQEKEYKDLTEKGDFEKDYDKIKMALNKMEKEIEELKKSQYKGEHLMPEVYEKSNKERKRLRGESSRDIRVPEDIKLKGNSKMEAYKKPKKEEELRIEPSRSGESKEVSEAPDHTEDYTEEEEAERMKRFAEILEEEREVAFDEEKITYQPKVVSLKGESIKSNYVKFKEISELTVISLRSLWKKGKEKQIFCIEGELKNTGSSCVDEPKISAKFSHKDKLVGVANCRPKSKIEVGEIVEFRLSFPISINLQEELSYQLTIEENEFGLSKRKSVQLFMIVDGKKIEMPIIFP